MIRERSHPVMILAVDVRRDTASDGDVAGAGDDRGKPPRRDDPREKPPSRTPPPHRTTPAFASKEINRLKFRVRMTRAAKDASP